MAPARAGYHHGDLRHALLETALRLIAEKGAEGFSLREAARALGVSPSAVYRHFSDKDALLAALASQGHAELAAAMERAIARVDAPEGSKARAVAAYVAIGEAYVEFAVRHPSHFRVMFGPCIQTEGFQPACAPSTGRGTFEILVATLDGLVAAGVLKAEARAGAEVAAWSSVHGLSALLVDRVLQLPARARADAVRFMGRTTLLGLGCDPRLAPGSAGPVGVDPRTPKPPPGKRG